MERRIGIGVVGAGFLAETRARCYAKAGGGLGQVVAVADSIPEKAEEYARKYSIPNFVTDFRKLLDMDEIDMVDLCVPNHLHRPMTEAAAAAGKHIVCTKPLTAYVGQDLPKDVDESEISAQGRRHMLSVVVEDAEAMVAAAEAAGVKLMYGENWIFSPSIAKAALLAGEASGTIVEMRGGECHSGSHSPFSKIWKYTGGGALLRLGAHPIGSMIYLKKLEGLARNGKPIRPVSVSAEVGDLSRIPSVQAESDEWFARGWKDVENWGSALLTFEDGSRGVVWASDTMLGGMESKLEVFMSNARIICNLSPNNLIQAYAPDAGVFAGEYLMEKLETKAGWSTPMPDEDWTSGHQPMCEEFVRAVAMDQPSPSDGHLGLEVVRAVYSAYVSAAEGCRIDL
ncbi:MAG: Gfo/Idh/MocA family oxidoreductase [Acidobacteriota bacterium]|nr:MAG: Gfo/Idh/MocA family oxidoreductase [Acidobacteriota bacterium]